MADTAAAQNFSSIAGDYDRHATVQAQAARNLLDFNPTLEPCRILEPGCGTGLYTALLANRYPNAAITAVDVSHEMLEVARQKLEEDRISFASGDAEAQPENTYDLITSNATFQWFTDLASTIKQYRNALRPGGALTFSYFGPETYHELAEALEDATGRENIVEAARFADHADLTLLMDRHFPRWSIREERYVREFRQLRDLLRTIKHTGTRGRDTGLRWTPGLLKRVERAYLDRHENIRATYQVFLCRGLTT